MRGMAGPLIKLIIFAIVTIMASYVLISTITNAGYGTQVTYRAQFSDVTGLVEGDEVRIAGVRVGQITSIGLAPSKDRPVAQVDLQVQKSVPVPDGVQATIRYRNLVGQRYIALTEAGGSGGRMLAAGGLIPLAHTRPALDLTVLFGGFRPLLQALSPADMNRLSFEIIQVFQGEGGTMQSLLTHVSSLTTSLANKDAVIGSVINNLSTVLGSVAARDQKLSDLIVNLQQFVTGLATDRNAIFNSLQSIDALATSTSGLLAQARPPLAADIKGLGKLSSNLADSRQVLEGFLKLAPMKIDLITRTAINGSWFNFFMCSASGYVVLPVTGANGQPTGITAPAGSGLANGAKGCS
jgi:virulence factor Mce-like protein